MVARSQSPAQIDRLIEVNLKTVISNIIRRTVVDRRPSSIVTRVTSCSHDNSVRENFYPTQKKIIYVELPAHCDL